MLFLFLAPSVLLYCTFFIYPSIQAFYVSFFDWNGFTASKDFIGLGNFFELFSKDFFWKVVFKNTLLIIFAGGFFIFAVAFLFAGLLSTNIRGRQLFRGLLFFPAVINPVAVAILWSFIYNKQWGLLNNILGIFGLGFLQKTWTAPEYLFWAILVAIVWMYTGFYCVILLAALDRVPPGQIEAAKLEGAGDILIFFRIKIPLIWDVLITALILWGITAVKEFSLLYAWGGGIDLPPDGMQNLAVHMYINAFGKRVAIFRMGYSTAMGVLMFLFVAVLVGAISLLTKRETIEY